MNNVINIVFPYNDQGIWMFDDERVGLEREALVAGVPEMLKILTKDIPNPEAGFCLLFSDTPFPGAAKMVRDDSEVEKDEDGKVGTWYIWEEQGLRGWLCPALSLYYPEGAPSEFWVEAKVKTYPIGL